MFELFDNSNELVSLPQLQDPPMSRGSGSGSMLNYRSSMTNQGLFHTDVASLRIGSSFVYTANDLVSDLQVDTSTVKLLNDG